MLFVIRQALMKEVCFFSLFYGKMSSAGGNMNYIKSYLDYLLYQKKYSDNTVTGYHEDLMFFKGFLDSKSISFVDVDYSVIRDFYSYMENFNYSINTISRRIASIRNFYKYLSRNNYIDFNPFTLVKMPKKDSRLPKFLYYNELLELFDSCDDSTLFGCRDRLILEILYATGVRVGELEYVKICDIDFDNNSIKVFGKGSKERYVYFGDYAREVLIKYLNFRDDDEEYLLINKNKKRLTARGISYILDNIIKKASLDLKVSPHMFRHSFATHLLNEGCDISTVQELLGHESLRATQVYTHITSDRLKSVYLKCHPRGDRKVGNDDEL